MSARESWTKRRARPGEATPTTMLAPAVPMNALQRCDRCGAQAYVRVVLYSHQDLLFCGHHYRQHAPALAKLAAGIQDETQRLVRADWPGSRS